MLILLFIIFNLTGHHEACFKFDFDSLGHDLTDKPIHDTTDPLECQELCLKEPRCLFFAVNSRNDPKENNGCWLKSGVGKVASRKHVILGTKTCDGIDFVVCNIKQK